MPNTVIKPATQADESKMVVGSVATAGTSGTALVNVPQLQHLKNISVSLQSVPSAEVAWVSAAPNGGADNNFVLSMYKPAATNDGTIGLKSGTNTKTINFVAAGD